MNIIIFYEEVLPDDNTNYIATYKNCTIKPSKGDSLIINEKCFVVVSVTIDYDTNNVYVAVNEI